MSYNQNLKSSLVSYQSLINYLDEKFLNIVDNLNEELDYFLPLLNTRGENKRCNDIKFIKISCHIMFVKELNVFVTNKQVKQKFDNILNQLSSQIVNKQFNSFIHKHLNSNVLEVNF